LQKNNMTEKIIEAFTKPYYEMTAIDGIIVAVIITVPFLIIWWWKERR